jgi:Peptidase family M1 domain/Omp85 superfamily domain
MGYAVPADYTAGTSPRRSLKLRIVSMAFRPMRIAGWVGLLLLLSAGAARADGPPEWLPRYNVDVVLDVKRQFVRVCEDVTWVNRGTAPVGEIVFNAHSAYKVPDKDVGLLAKMLEILRMTPKEALSLDGPALTVEDASVQGNGGKPFDPPPGIPDNKALAFGFDPENQTALILRLPEPVEPGQSVTVRLNFVMKLPARKGRWGQWDGVTTLCQWLPVVAVHDSKGFHPTPFIPWHQPFYNEAGHYTVRVVLPCDQKLAGSSAEKSVTDMGDGWKTIEFEPACLRDFALVASSRFQEWWAEADGVKVRCLAFPEHEFYAKALLDAACKAIPVYNHWFGRYPYPQFTIVEACFGWNGNECGGLVMIDDRMFRMPHLASHYPTYLLQHELCHQWWYNVIGTNGYAETWMDEGPATYFSHRLNDKLMGVNNQLLEYPKGLDWLPNIHREDLRNYSYLGARKRGDIHPTVQNMEKYGHLVNLSAAAYDRGSKVIGLIEERLGEAAFLEFCRHIFRKYQFRILLVHDFQHELEEMTGRSWEDFFQQWVFGTGMCDWSVERVEIDGASGWRSAISSRKPAEAPVKVVVHLKQQGSFNEPTTLGIRLEGGKGYQIRIPIYPDVPVLQLDDPSALIQCRISPGPKNAAHADVRVELILASAPEQITVDPDRMLLDENPTNNHWKAEQRWRLTPLYTQLDETDVTNSYDRWNFVAGPWAFTSSYSDPWFTRGPMVGLRAGAYRTQEFFGGAYVAYRSDDRNVVAGVDGMWDHVGLPNVQIGFTLERSLFTLGPQDIPDSRGVVYARYVLMYGDSLYLPPFHYVETFAFAGNRGLPDPRTPTPGADPFDERPALGAHYHLNLLTPYWDAEGGIAADLTYQYGLPIFGNQRTFQELYGQVSFVKSMPRVFDWIGSGALVRWLNDTRFAFRAGGAGGLPSNGELFSLGGGDRFRGFDTGERQGSSIWVGSVEWRVPVMKNLDWDVCDHVAGLRNVYLAPFYDVGDSYLKGQSSSLGDVAQAVGVGLRLDVVWLGMIERTMLRFDVAKTLSSNTPIQFWFGVQHPF